MYLLDVLGVIAALTEVPHIYSAPILPQIVLTKMKTADFYVYSD